MIFLLGGTSETSLIAEAIASGGVEVLVSTASDTPLDVGNHPGISRRSGPLDLPAMEQLIRTREISAVVDATHPYAEQASATARGAAAQAAVPYFTFIRESALEETDDVIVASDHEFAARDAFGFGCPVLLTTGAGNLGSYVALSREKIIRLVARVLDRPESVAACQAAGLDAGDIILGRGPFDVETNRQHIRFAGAGVIVTKDGGKPSGLREKLIAAKLEGARVVVVARPSLPASGVYRDIDALVGAVLAAAN